MEKIKTTAACGTVIEVKISDLRITAEDLFLKSYVAQASDRVEHSPQYYYLIGYYKVMSEWMQYRNLDYSYITTRLMYTLKSLISVGQLEPIKIYKDMRINTGHKRAACMLFLGYETIKAIIVPDDTKL